MWLDDNHRVGRGEQAEEDAQGERGLNVGGINYNHNHIYRMNGRVLIG